MTPQQHYKAAEHQLDEARANLEAARDYARAMALIASAHVHATLATVDPTVALGARRSERRPPHPPAHAMRPLAGASV